MEHLLKLWKNDLDSHENLRDELVKPLKEKQLAGDKTFNTLIIKLEGIGKLNWLYYNWGSPYHECSYYWYSYIYYRIVIVISNGTSTTTNANSPTPDESNQEVILEREYNTGGEEEDGEKNCFVYAVTRAINDSCIEKNIHVHFCWLQNHVEKMVDKLKANLDLRGTGGLKNLDSETCVDYGMTRFVIENHPMNDDPNLCIRKYRAKVR